MMSLLLVLLVQVQEPTVEDRIAAFLKGDAAARESLVKLGARAIAPLHQARDKAPEKIDALILDIKKAVAYPKLEREPNILGMKCDLKMERAKPADVLAYLQEFCGAALLSGFEDADLKVPAVGIDLKGATVPQALDRMCREAGLDYGFFHNVLVVSKPDRLWGSGKTPPVFGPPATDRQHRTPEDDQTIENLRKQKVNLDTQNADLKSMIDYVKEVTSFAFEVDPADRKPIPVFRVKDLSVFDVLALVTQLRDLDFIVEKDKVIIGPRSEIEKRIAGKK